MTLETALKAANIHRMPEKGEKSLNTTQSYESASFRALETKSEAKLHLALLGSRPTPSTTGGIPPSAARAAWLLKALQAVQPCNTTTTDQKGA